MTLTGDAMNEGQYLATCEPQLKGTIMTFRLMLVCHFGDYKLTEQALEELTSSTVQVLKVHFHFSMHHFYAGMT
jgi:hypothetical protein